MTDDGSTQYAERIASLFSGLTRAHGVYQVDPPKKGVTKRAGRAKTVNEEVTIELWERHLKGEQGLGIVPIRDDSSCVFGAIDIDKYDLDFEKVEASLAAMNLPVVLCRTKSGGLHAYVFTSEPVAASLLKTRLGEWATAIGFGGSEIFPKQEALLGANDIGNWINMPYFGALSSEGTQRYAIFKGQQLTLDEFLARAERFRISEEQLEALLIPEGEDFFGGPPCLQALARAGGIKEGGRNKGLFNIIVYLKKRFPDNWQELVADYNARFIVEPLKSGEVTPTVKSLTRKDYNYKCNDSPIKEVCNRKLCKKRDFGVGKDSGAEDWPFMIDNDAQCVLTDPPYWIVTVEGKRVRMVDEHFTSQLAFQRLILNKLHVIPPVLKPGVFVEKMNDILKNAQNVEAPDDSGAAGELKWYLQQFCTVHPQAETREELLVGKPWTEEGRTYFRSPDFRKFLQANNFRDLGRRELYAELREAGVQHCQLAVRRGVSIQVWHVPAYAPVNNEPEETPDGKVVPLVPARRVPADNTEM